MKNGQFYLNNVEDECNLVGKQDAFLFKDTPLEKKTTEEGKQ
jgi:hypothetical protein